MITYAKLKHLKDSEFQRFHYEIMKYHEKVGYFYDWSRQWEYPWILRNLPLKETDTVLDVGGGTCHFPAILAKRVKKIHVGDLYSERMFKPVPENVEFLKMDASNYKSVNKYDVVLCISVLEHIENYVDAINNIKDLVKPDGYLAMTLDLFLDNTRNCKKADIQKILEILNEFEIGEIDLGEDDLYSKKNLQSIKADLPNLYSRNYKDRTSLGVIIRKKK